LGAPAEAGRTAVRRVVCDTGPFLHLAEARCLEILRQAGELHIPPAVEAELRRQDIRRPAETKSWLKLSRLALPHEIAAEAWCIAGLLHRGEAEAVELARQLHADWFLTDDAAARLVAQSCGLETHGSLGVVLWSAAARHLSRNEAESALEGLAQSSLWLSASVLAEARAALHLLFASSKP
jgi:predicted nucleic acid-binding protein